MSLCCAQHKVTFAELFGKPGISGFRAFATSIPAEQRGRLLFMQQLVEGDKEVEIAFRRNRRVSSAESAGSNSSRYFGTPPVTDKTTSFS
jgi:hypothetical protein